MAGWSSRFSPSDTSPRNDFAASDTMTDRFVTFLAHPDKLFIGGEEVGHTVHR